MHRDPSYVPDNERCAPSQFAIHVVPLDHILVSYIDSNRQVVQSRSPKRARLCLTEM